MLEASAAATAGKGLTTPVSGGTEIVDCEDDDVVLPLEPAEIAGAF